MSDQLLHEIFRLGRGELFVEINDEQVLHAESADEGDFMLGCAQQVRCRFWSQNFFRMRIERDHDWRSTRSARMLRRRRNHCLMAAVDAVKNADRQKKRSA